MRRLGHHIADSIWKWFGSLSYRFRRGTVQSLIAGSAVLLCSLTFPAGWAAGFQYGADEVIPQDAIRIRIVANSDDPFDQQVKREVQSRIASEIASWGEMPGTHDEAKALVASHLTDVQAAADQVLEGRKAGYGAEVRLGDTPFPAKTFGGREYAAGNYEALYIQLGSGQGANWWCVLFPPLCLTAAVAADGDAAVAQSPAGAVGQGDADSVDGQAPVDDMSAKPKPKFFIWTMLQKLGAWLKAMLHG
jgi:stage II sporulation protein R